MPSSAGDVPVLLEQLVAPHVESFDYFLGDGLRLVVEGLAPLEVHILLVLSPHPRHLPRQGVGGWSLYPCSSAYA